MRYTLTKYLLSLLSCTITMVANAQYVDLGLTSKTLWATCNLGATAPEEFGDFYAWGETTTKTTFYWANYTHCDGDETSVHNIGSSIVGTGYDAAKAVLGEEWCMPTTDQMTELINECSFKKQTVNGVVCMKVTGPNGNSIILPLTGYKYNTSHDYKAQYGFYWTGNDDVLDNSDYKATVNALTPEKVSAFVNDVILKAGNNVEVIMMPEE